MGWWVLLLLAVLLALPWTKNKGGRKAAALSAPSAPAAGQPITTQKDARAALSALLVAHGYGRRNKELLRESLSELAQEMKQHAEELRSDIEYLREEIGKQKEYRAEIAEDLRDAMEEPPENDAEAQALAKTQRHLGHLNREIAQMQAELDKHHAALKAFRADRTAFVTAYAAYVLNRGPNPSHLHTKTV